MREDSLALSRQLSGCLQAGVRLHLMAKIHAQAQRHADAMQHIREAVAIFKEIGSWHLPDAEKTLHTLQQYHIYQNAEA